MEFGVSKYKKTKPIMTMPIREVERLLKHEDLEVLDRAFAKLRQAYLLQKLYRGMSMVPLALAVITAVAILYDKESIPWQPVYTVFFMMYVFLDVLASKWTRRFLERNTEIDLITDDLKFAQDRMLARMAKLDMEIPPKFEEAMDEYLASIKEINDKE